MWFNDLARLFAPQRTFAPERLAVCARIAWLMPSDNGKHAHRRRSRSPWRPDDAVRGHQQDPDALRDHRAGAPGLMINGLSAPAVNWALQEKAFAPHFEVITFDKRGVAETGSTARSRLHDRAGDGTAALEVGAFATADRVVLLCVGHGLETVEVVHPLLNRHKAVESSFEQGARPGAAVPRRTLALPPGPCVAVKNPKVIERVSRIVRRSRLVID